MSSDGNVFFNSTASNFSSSDISNTTFNDLLFVNSTTTNSTINITNDINYTTTTSTSTSIGGIDDVVATGGNNSTATTISSSYEYSMQLPFGIMLFVGLVMCFVYHNSKWYQQRIQQQQWFQQQQQRGYGRSSSSHHPQQQPNTGGHQPGNDGNRPTVEAIRLNQSNQTTTLSVQEFHDRLLHTINYGELTKWTSERKIIKIHAVPASKVLARNTSLSGGHRKRSDSSLSVQVITSDEQNDDNNNNNNNNKNDYSFSTVVEQNITEVQASTGIVEHLRVAQTMSNCDDDNNTIITDNNDSTETEPNNECLLNGNDNNSTTTTTVDPESLLQRTTTSELPATNTTTLRTNPRVTTSDQSTSRSSTNNNSIPYEESTINNTATIGVGSNRTTTILPKDGSLRTINRVLFHLSSSTNIDICSICLDELHDEDYITALPQCHHVFHTHCIREWLIDIQSTYCPICKCNVK